MGARTDQAEQRVDQQRARMGRRIGDLRERAQHDVEQVGNSARDRVSYVTDQVSEATNRVTDKAPSLDQLNEFVSSRPFSAVTGALGVGVALGMASEMIPMPSMGGDGQSQESQGGSHRSQQGSSGQQSQISRMISPMIAGVAQPMQEELRTWFRETLRGASDGKSQRNSQQLSSSSDGSQPQQQQQMSQQNAEQLRASGG